MKKIQVITMINFIINGIFWILALLCLLFNILGLWKLWNITCFGSLFYIFITIPSLIIAIIMIIKDSSKLYLNSNIVIAIITVFFAILTFSVFSNWFR